MSTQYTINSNDEDTFVVAFVAGQALPLVAAKSGNPNFDAIVAGLVSGGASADELVRLFDVSVAVSEKFEKLSDRVLVEGGNVLFDGEVVGSPVAKQIVRFLDEGEDFVPLVAFMENVMDNPNEHSREQLYSWLDRRDFTITSDGMIVGYKGVAADDEFGFRSISSGREPVYVTDEDGETAKFTGRIPNPVGATVEMSRNLVQHDPSVGCHVGLHVGTWDYANSFARGTVLEVHVNPRDVVSVPTDCDWAKVRVCKYTVVQAIDAPYSSGLLDADGYRDEDDEIDWDFDL
jgi:hypothetical protein